ncbi:hypothetical protein VTN49DRAFT_2977 [Thermomyces lanuginosus]|uniref:uncharacterized protein n=1 Tax=Thermomyces lanuginosus TaxID=5541 RepID=UPI003743AF5D
MSIALLWRFCDAKNPKFRIGEMHLHFAEALPNFGPHRQRLGKMWSGEGYRKQAARREKDATTKRMTTMDRLLRGNQDHLRFKLQAQKRTEAEGRSRESDLMLMVEMGRSRQMIALSLFQP